MASIEVATVDGAMVQNAMEARDSGDDGGSVVMAIDDDDDVVVQEIENDVVSCVTTMHD